MSSAYTYPLLALKLNLYSTVPLCYLQHGTIGLVAAGGMCIGFLTILALEHRKRVTHRNALYHRLDITDDDWEPNVCSCCSRWGFAFIISTVF